jgi:hypothetical protein
MIMQRYQNAMRGQANLANQSRTFSKLGVVSAYDPNTYSVKVQFPDGLSNPPPETGWIPLGSSQVGAGFGIYAAPNIADQIEVRFQEGDRDSGVAGPLFFDNQSPPVPVPSGEIWMVHKSGSCFKLHNDGSIEVVGNGTWTGDTSFIGNMDISENVTVGTGASGSFTTPTGQTVMVQDGIITNIF